MKILLGWELGAGQGHIQRLVALAQTLTAYGCTPVFALKSYNFKGQSFPWQRLLAPRLPFSGRNTSYTFADILATFGFNHVNLLSSHLQSWQEILLAVKPALVVADHAPGLVLAARGLVPTVVIGSHFAVPPPIEVFPILKFPAPPESLEYQAQVSDTVRKVVKLDVSLGHALNGDRSFIFSIPELDCYRAWRKNPQYVGVHIAPLPTHPPHAPMSTWAYLANDYSYRDLVLKTLHPNNDFRPLHDVVTNQSLAIHHGGLTTTIGCLLAGIPQLLLPRYLEQQLNAVLLTRLGAAQSIISPTWESLLITQAQLYALAEKASRLAKDFTHWNQNFTEIILKTCLELGQKSSN
ncbi:MAG: glycosyltransferase [Leptolyngbya sp. BL-A-14]